MALLRRSLKYVAVAIGVMVGLLAVAAASVFAYGEAESNRVTSLPGPTGPYAVGRVSFHWTDRSREEVFTEKQGDRRELMGFVWYPARKLADGAKTATYLPGRWGEVRQDDYGAWDFIDRYLQGGTEPLLRAQSARYPEVRFESRPG